MSTLAARGGWLWLAVLTALLPFGTRAQAADAGLALPQPAPVVDQYGLLSSDEQSRLDELVRRIKAKSGVELTIFIPSSLQGREIEDFSIAVAEAWKLGRKKEDKGLLMIVAPKERKMRIEVGYGLEGELTDAFTRRVLDDGMRPLFKQGRYYDGIVNAIGLLQEKIPLGLEQADVPAGDDGGVAFGPGVKILILFLVVMYFLSLVGRIFGFGGYRRRWGGGWYGGGWGGGGFGGGGWGGSSGGSWGGGGGGFGGGGSSSNW